MEKNMRLLCEKFQKIKNLGMTKALRTGSTGVGYTFEYLLGKKEDQKCKPDFNGIEIKCKLGYSKSAVTLFNCIPLRNSKSAINYIFDKYSYHRFNDFNDYKLFERKVFSKYSLERYNYSFKLGVDYYLTEVVLKAYKNKKFVENVCYWDFRTLERKLKGKISKLAIVKVYPYHKNKETYYKYVSMDLYKLIGFFEFLRLIEQDKIYVNFYIKEALGNSCVSSVEDHGVGFRIKQEYIEELFYKIKKKKQY